MVIRRVVIFVATKHTLGPRPNEGCENQDVNGRSAVWAVVAMEDDAEVPAGAAAWTDDAATLAALVSSRPY